MVDNKDNKVDIWFLISMVLLGFSFGIGFEIASWIVDTLMQSLGFPLG